MKGKRRVADSAAGVWHCSHGHVPGQVLAVGQGDVGQLGLGEEVLERTRAALVRLPAPVVQVEAGGMHTVCLTENGEVYTFGCNDEGGLGRDTTEEGSETTPGRVALPKPTVQVSAGDSHTAALARDGTVFIWGSFRDNSGVIGLLEAWEKSVAPKQLHTTEAIVKISSARLLVPQAVRIKGSGRLKFQDVFCGAYFTFALTSEGRVYCFGLSNYHQLGTQSPVSVFMPQVTAGFQGSAVSWVSFSGGQHHSLCLDSTGQVYSLGRAEYGRLGLGVGAREQVCPAAVPELSRATVVACGASVSYAITSDGCALSWGMGTNMQLGTGEEDDAWSPVQMRGKQLDGHAVLAVSSGGQHTMLLIKDQS
ncbi:regulator of chromosome condensation isoform X2 [Amia ocellicauda]|uniref:regulator of chromosome condensation isoform X2 n=1 Tax=Amia ocellicauda TaxID=2972642 RepID=UPI0034647110